MGHFMTKPKAILAGWDYSSSQNYLFILLYVMEILGKCAKNEQDLWRAFYSRGVLFAQRSARQVQLLLSRLVYIKHLVAQCWHILCWVSSIRLDIFMICYANQIMLTPLIEIGVVTEKVSARLVPVLVVVIGTVIVIAIVAIREKEIAVIGLRKTIGQSFLENSLNNAIHEC